MSDEVGTADSIAVSHHKEESLRLKTLAEQKFASGDLKSALNYANRAHDLHPSLDALPEMITAFEILHAAEDTPAIDGSSENQSAAPDYYKILQTERFAHPNTIKKQYRTLALALHPDKNPFPASAEAFKLVGEASRVLSDKNRRKMYDTRLRMSMQSEATEEVGLAEKFWTSCSACLLLHQMERKYVGHSLVCPSCKKNFKAMEVKEDSNNGVDVEKSPIRVSARIRDRNAKGASCGMVERCGLGVKRKLSSISDVLQRSGRVENSVNGEEEDDTMTLSQLKVLVKKEKGQVEEKEKDVGNGGENEKEGVKKNELKTYKRRVRKDHNIAEIINVPCSSPQHSERDNSEVLQVEMNGKREKRERQRVSKYGNNFKVTEIGKSKNREDSEFERLISKKKGDLEIMPVEDSEFHDFDKGRTGRSFRKGQIWALYDDVDGMPRHYGLIDEIVSIKPFEVSLYWLLFQTNGDEELINRRKMGFCISCGSFKVSRRVSVKYLNLFSHVVDCERASREIYRIYPTKGSVWGLYRDNNTNNNKRCYDIVICLSSYSEVHGLSIGYLEKVPGFRTVFKRKEIGANAVICISDVSLFSHEIPAKRLSGQEDAGLPKDCWELDPASLAQLLMVDIVA